MPRTRRSFLKAGITAGAAGSALGFPMIARAQQSFNWKMTSAYAKGAPFYMDGPGSATDLAKRIEAMSNGRMRIFSPLKSPIDLISFLNHPVICTPVLPQGNATMPKGAYTSCHSGIPPPS